MPKFRRPTIVALVCAALLLGLMLAIAPGIWQILGLLIGLITLFIIARLHRRVALMLLLALAVGSWRGQAVEQQLNDLNQLVGQKVTLLAQVADDPVPAAQFYSLRLDHLRIGERSLPFPAAAISANSALKRGYSLQVTGKVKPTQHGVMQLSFVTVQITSQRLSWLETLRQRFIAGIHTALPDPFGGFALGLLLGARALIPKDLQAQLTATGLSHLVAVSGYNLTIIAGALQRPLSRLSHRLSVLGALWAVGLFVAVAGSSASITRAAIVSVLSLTAAYYGRRWPAGLLLLIPAAATALYHPSFLWYDVGWWLSFAAFAGILVVAPLIDRRRLSMVGRAVVESLSAQLLTFPIILAVFGQFSPVSVLANALILPLVPLAMLVAMVAGLAGGWVPVVAGWLALPAIWLLRLMIWVVGQLASWPGANLKLAVTPWQLVVIALTVATITALLIRRQRRAADAIIPVMSNE